ncbi:MAG: hypothetical protein AWM53_01440 [Candidatus Dichloromethanomonas elyunquensis]|nr:MAG: hypothetical protein AWM53_01440 [Candidatus Dichloromethanomonas elyunquensis]
MHHPKNTPVIQGFGTCSSGIYGRTAVPLINATYQRANPYGLKAAPPNLLLLTPAIFGATGMFILGFSFYGRPLSFGYSKFIFFVCIGGIICSLGAGMYIYELLLMKDVDSRLYDIVLPLLTVAIFFATAYNLTYSLYPSSFSGTIGKTRITQFLSFLALSIGSISVGETFDVSPQTSEVQILLATESFWNLFALSLLISLLV